MEGDRRSVNSELWHACAGPKISLPSVGSLVVYFPQGHSEQVAASTLKEVDGQIPNYPNLQSQLVCQLHNVALHADVETDEVFAQMTLQPVNEQEKELFLPPDVGTPNRQPNDFFCKTLTASDTSTHGGFSVPRRAAEKVFPPLDFTKQPPAQELRAKDLHDHVWTFRHIYRGQPKRHLLTTGWSVFVSAKRLVAGDSVLFIRDDKGQLLLGIRRANSRQQAVLPSSVLSSDSMHIGVLAAAAHAAATSSRFQVFYNPRTSPSEFVIPLSKYRKAVHFTQVSVGMRFRMVFETEESTLRRYMGTVTGIADLDPNRWPGSKWRNLEVGWDESSAGERPRRVSLWEIEPVSTPFLICPPPFALRPKRPSYPGLLGDENDFEGSMKRCLTWLRGENSSSRDLVSSSVQGFGGDSSWIQFQQLESLKPEVYNAVTAATLSDLRTLDASKVMQQSPLQQGQFRLLQQHSLPPHLLQPQPPLESQQSHTIWPQASGHPQILPSQQPQLPPASLLQQSTAITQSQTLPTSQSQPISLTQTTPLLVNPPSLPLTQPRPQSPLPQVYPAQLQQQQQQLQQQQQQQQHQQQLVIQQSLPQTQPHGHATLPQQALQCLPQTHHSLPQAHQSAPQTHPSLPHMHPSLPQTHPSLSQTHQCMSQTQVSLSQSQQSLSSQSQHSGLQTQQHPSQTPEVSSHLPQMTFSRSQSSPNLPAIRPLTTFTETEIGFGCPSGGTNSFAFKGMLGKSHGSLSGGDDNGQLTSLLRASQSLMQLPQQQKSSVPQTSVVQQQQPPQPQSQPQPQPQSALQRQNHHAQDAIAPALPALPQIETQLTGSWFPFSRDGIQCESPLLSTVQIGQSDASSVVTSCSYSLPPEPLDNTLLVPPTTGSFQTKFGNFNKEVQCRPVNDNVMGPFSSPSGSFTSTTPDGGRMSAAGLLTSSALEEAVLPRTWSQVPAPVRTFTKVHKSGCVGRSVDLSRLKSYEELRYELARMFNIEGQLEDPQRSYWQLVFVDHVGDILLVGDDPWDEFVSYVRTIKILSTAQVLQMNQEGLEQLSSLPLQQQTSSSSDDCHVWKDA